MSSTTILTQNDTGPDFEFTVKDKYTGALVDLTGSTVKFPFRLKDGDGTVINTGHTTCTLTTPLEGECKYVFQSGDLVNVGHHEGELEITFASGKKQTSRIIRFYVRGEIG